MYSIIDVVSGSGGGGGCCCEWVHINVTVIFVVVVFGYFFPFHFCAIYNEYEA